MDVKLEEQQPHQCYNVEFIAVNTNSDVLPADYNNLLKSCLIGDYLLDSFCNYETINLNEETS